jgi:hypothetical protein
MSRERRDLAALLVNGSASPDGSENDLAMALEALRRAAAWSARALRDRDLRVGSAEPAGTGIPTAGDPTVKTPTGGDDGLLFADDGALAAVIGLDDALTELTALGELVPALLAAAEPGRAVEEHMRTLDDDLKRIDELVAAARTRADDLDRRKADVQARLAELAELRGRVDELRRAERLAAALDELSAARSAIEDRLAALTPPVAETVAALTGAAGRLLPVVERGLAALDPDLRDLLGRAAAEHDALVAEQEQFARVEAELAETAARLRELRNIRANRLADLDEHARADREVLGALAPAPAEAPAAAQQASTASSGGMPTTAAERVSAILDDIDAKLRHIDGALGTLLADRDARERPRPPIPWSDPVPRP